MSHSSDLPIRWEALQILSDGDEAFEQELLKLFVRDAQVHLDQLLVAMSQTDYAAIYAAAHHLKGASGTVGAIGIQQVAKILEDQAQSQYLPPNASELSQKLANQLQQITDYVSSLDAPNLA